jgi:hypothetical protein
MVKNTILLEELIERGLRGRADVGRGFADLVAKVGREISDADAASNVRAVTYNFFTSLNPMAFACRRIVNGETRQVEGATNCRTPPALPANLPAGAESPRRPARAKRKEAT